MRLQLPQDASWLRRVTWLLPLGLLRLPCQAGTAVCSATLPWLQSLEMWRQNVPWKWLLLAIASLLHKRWSGVW